MEQSPKATQEPPTACDDRCQKLVDASLENIKVKHLVDEMEKAGCEVPRQFFACKPCQDEGIIAAFASDVDQGQQVVICSDNIEKFKIGQKHIDRTLAHELIHAYDDCRANLDWKNCLHIACTEVRAANLSGDCYFKEEFNRGQFKFKGQGEKCIRRRAELSVGMHPHCTNIAKQAVETVFTKCFEDRSPFIGKFL
uniref:Mitochondrial inner membrane protease ATP23 n=1 Tax=Mucochytrium quahogii TaxID=96639 RepID=A0A7S2W3M8_9STRA|mmetsp:Transcript_14427/g.23488  ORF Transcript_14427/g.23488 Transcript_14427/m.23488 type:complete len:196 (-) Transcript_14427:35-622(-)